MGFYRIFGCLYGRLSSKMEYNNSQSLFGGAVGVNDDDGEKPFWLNQSS